MAEAMIDILAEHLFSALKEQGQYALEFQSQFEDMREQLDLMKSFHADACKLKRKEETVKTTLSMLRELIYEAEDILLDCLIRADYRKEGSYCNSFSPRDLLFQYRTGKKLKDINKRIEKMQNYLSSYFKTVAERSNHEENSSIGKRWTSPAFDEYSIVGLTEDTKKIKGWILPRNKTLHKVGIVGMGGLGKTTITQNIFKDEQVIRRFEKRIWVSVSQIVNEEEIMRTMLKQLGEDSTGLDKGQMLQNIQQVLADKNYLIVMDDVWRVADGWWDKICAGLPKREGQSSGIIITTRQEHVAREMGVETAQMHLPKLLNEEESWSLFCKFAFSSDEEVQQHSELEEVGRDIVKKCRGLPLAIKTVGGLLRCKTRSTEVWRRICNNFRDELATRGSDDNSVMASLQLSYDELPTRLKQCLLCFSIYPEDSEICAEQLVRWWIGEGFIQGKVEEGSIQGKDTKTTTELAFDYLSELISRCLVEVVQQRDYDGRVYSCKMHDLVRDLTILMAREDGFSSFDEQGRQKPTANSRHLGITSEVDVKPSSKNEVDMKSLNSNSKLRALLMMTSCPIRFDRNIGLSSVKSLRVLDFSQSKLDTISIEDLLKWISSLKRLAYLNLRGVAALKELPNSIGKLRNLQLLVLTGCNHLQKLPSSIMALQKLTVLDIGYCPVQYLPQGLGRLSFLQELSGFKLASAANEEGCRLRDLQDLVQLRVLRINISEESEIAKDDLTVLSQLEQLKVLSINTEGCENEQIFQNLDRLSPPPQLEELYLRYYRGKNTPNWINPISLRALRYLCIENGDIECMSPIFEGSKGITWKVEGLCLKFLARLQVEWEMVQSVMPQIKYMEVSHCYKLTTFPCNVEKLGVWRK